MSSHSTTVTARLDAQRHRRVVKTHTPLDGIPHDPRVTYLVIGRHPLDAAVSLYHQGDNIDRERLHQLTGTPPPRCAVVRPPVDEWLVRWIDTDADPHTALDSMPGVLWHLSAALLTPAQLERYHRRAAELAPADLLAWLHRGRD